ncbi:protein ANTAGONIST OF LIKE HETEROCHROMATIN PROTEIN 1-like [Oreochromis niloticus]|uniref:protein ANTAGONIST OF LIKE HETEROCHROMATIN PROTEIN 1-like n=1 Tax=Oreochromis niloticus TaxID=8128 RepID=UPI000DF4C6E6|nr:protein ANTAGONIST OF LIKE HETEROCHROMATIN PROTEIN 1-like [Oreochromis niloticus]
MWEEVVCKMAAVDLAFEERVSLLYLLWRAEQRRKGRPHRTLVHQVLHKREQFGEFHHLLQDLRLDDGRFQRYHLLSLAQFEELLSCVGASIARLDTNYRRSIPPAERLSICLRFLATGDSFRTIASSFRVGVSTVSQIVPQVATAIWDCLVDNFMAVPSTGDWRSIAEGFQERWNFPLCSGALNGKHVQMKAPPNSGSMFHNYKGTFSIVLLAVVDAGYRFRIIDVGGYGRTSDGGILANLTFGQALRAGTLHLPPDQPLPGGEDRGAQPHVFVADEAFPLRRELMRPFPGHLLPLEKRIFNYRLSRARLVVECAFGILSSQWRLYRRSMELRPEVAEKCVKATCVLHHFLRCLDERGAPAVRGVAPAVVEPLQGLGRVAANNSSREAVLVREKFMAHFSAEGAVSWQPKE